MFDTNPMFAPGLGHKQNLTAFNNLSKGIALVMTATVLLNSTVLQKVHARAVDLDTLCQKFPLNSRCQGYKSPSQAQDATVLQAPKVIKLRLDTSGSRNEWIRIEVSGNTVKPMHTTRRQTNFSRTASTILGFIPSPIPLFLPSFYEWRDHQTTGVVFKPDNCSGDLAPAFKQLLGSAVEQPSISPCAIAGIDSVVLPEGMNLRQGLFTINYTERKLLRAITFRVPEQK